MASAPPPALGKTSAKAKCSSSSGHRSRSKAMLASLTSRPCIGCASGAHGMWRGVWRGMWRGMWHVASVYMMCACVAACVAACGDLLIAQLQRGHRGEQARHVLDHAEHAQLGHRAEGELLAHVHQAHLLGLWLRLGRGPGLGPGFGSG